MIVFRYIYVLLTVILFAFSSCEDERYDNTYRVPATFTPFTKGNDEASITSRASGTSWTSGDQVGIYMVTSGGSVATNANRLATNIPYAISFWGPDASLIPVNQANTIYYPVDGSNVNFVSYYPYQSGITTTYSVDVATQTNPANIDLLYHKGTTGYSRYNAAASLEFKHQLSKIVINVTRGTNVTTDLSGLTSTITGTPTKANFTLATGTFTNLETVATVTPLKSSSTVSTKYIAEAILVPHTGTGYTRTMIFTVNGTTYTYTIPTTQVYETGKSYTYTLLLTTSGIALQETTITNWGTGVVSWGQYALTTNTGWLNSTPDATSQTLTIKYQGTTIKPEAVISTSGTDSKAGTVSWLTATLASNTSTSGSWTNRSLYVYTSVNTTGYDRFGYIHISLEGLSVVITVEQSSSYDYTATDGLANCYMVEPNHTITIPIRRAYEYGGADGNTKFGVEKYWDDASGKCVSGYSVTNDNDYELSYLTVTAGSNTGNALLALIGDDGEVYWSYHIWVTKYNPNAGGSTVITGNTYNSSKYYEFMNINLGAKFSYLVDGPGSGLYYQWGRKDPFPSEGEPGEEVDGGGSYYVRYTDSSRGTIVGTIRNPNYFMTAGSSSNYDWYYDNPASGGRFTRWLWGNEKKSVYDPCPQGWKIPQVYGEDSPFAGYDVNNSWEWGADIEGTVWGTMLFPETWSLDLSTGDLYDMGESGFWIVWDNDDRWGYYQRFDSDPPTEYFYQTNIGRAAGMPVRCIRE